MNDEQWLLSDGLAYVPGYVLVSMDPQTEAETPRGKFETFQAAKSAAPWGHWYEKREIAGPDEEVVFFYWMVEGGSEIPKRWWFIYLP